MKRYVVLEKQIGETPLMALTAWKKENPEYENVPASYAGRLDPMASGKLLILLGDECKKQKRYTGLDKEYEVEVLLDAGSDTGDVLGLVERAGKETRPADFQIQEALQKEIGAHLRAYPKFSSKVVGGKPLFLRTLEGSLSEISIPKHVERIHRIQHLATGFVSSADVKRRVGALLELVPKTDEPSKMLGADFRIDAVRKTWESVFEIERAFCVLRLRVTCASGTYMRSLAGRIGELLGTKALALSIRRTKIGRYVSLGKFGFWITFY